MALTDSGVRPLEAMIGTFGNDERMRATISGVLRPPATLSMEAPLRSLAPMFSSSPATVTTTGMSTTRAIRLRSVFGNGEFNTSPAAPCASASVARYTARMPWVVPPPTPQNTGIGAMRMIPWLIERCAVNG